MATLTGHLVADTYKALLKLIDNDILTASEKQISDGFGGGSNVFIDQNGFLRAAQFKVTGGTSSQFLKGNGSLDSNTYLTAAVANTLYLPIGSTTTAIAEGTRLYFTTARVLATTLAGFTPITGTVTASDTILSAIEKIWWNIVNGGGGGGGGYVPYIGATQNLNLGTYGLISDFVQFNVSNSAVPTTAGTMSWNNTDGTADLKLKGGNVTLQVGQEQVTRVVNKTGVNLLEANYQAVYISGAQGQRLKVDLALAVTDGTSAGTLGLVTENINNNQEGFVTSSGLVNEIDTTGDLQGETWADGDILYLSPLVAGDITNIKPLAPEHTVIMGFVVYAHAIHGKIYVKVDNGYEIEELHDVQVITRTDTDILQWYEDDLVWRNIQFATALDNAGGIIGLGDINYVPRFDGTNSISNSRIFDDLDNVIIGGTVGIIPNPFGMADMLTVLNGNIAIEGGYSYRIDTHQILQRTNATGEFRIGTDVAGDFITLYAGTSERARLTAAGYLGVGLTAPSSMIHAKDSTAYGKVIIDNTGATGGGSFSARQNGTETAIFGVSGAWQANTTSDAAIVATRGGQGIKFYTDGSATAKGGIDSVGNSFIGQLPAYYAGATNFIVQGISAAAMIGVTHMDNSIKGIFSTLNSGVNIGSDTPHPVIFRADDIESARIASDGKWLFGTNVNDNVNIVQVNGSIIATSLKKSGGIATEFLKADGSVDSNLYYLDSNPDNYIPLTAISSTAFGLTYTNTTGVISLTAGFEIPTTTDTTNWDIAYLNRITSATAPLSITTNVISISQASGSVNGFLSSTDWNTFNNKTSNTGTVTSVSMTVPTGLSISGSPITTSGTLAVTLTAGYVIPTTASATTWDTAYNRSLTAIAVSGTTTKTLTLTKQDGTTLTASWSDINTDAVTSVFGRTGAIVATSGDYTTAQVTESGNLYYTDVRSRTALSFVAGSGAYNSTTGVITIPTNNNQITNGSAYITLTAISATSPIVYNNITGVISMPVATTSVNGYLSSTDWNTFNNKSNTNGTVTSVSGTGTVSGLTLTGTVTTTGSLTLGGTLSLTSGNVTSALGFTPVTNARTLTINGTAYDLSADRSWTVSGTIGGLTTNKIPKATSATTLGDSNLINDASGNLGLGVTPSAWSGLVAIQSAYGVFAGNLQSNILLNAYYDVNTYRYVGTGEAARYRQDAGTHAWLTAPSGTAGNAITFTQAMTLVSNGNLLVGNTSDSGYKLDVNGTGRFSGNLTIYNVNGNFLQSTQLSNNAQFQTWYASNGTTRRGYFGYPNAGGDNFALMNENNSSLIIGTNSISALTIASTGAATFSSSVTANGGIIGNANDNYFGNYPSGDYWDIGNLGATGNVYLEGRGVSTNINQQYRAKGSGSHIWSYNAGSNEIMRTTSGGNVLIGTTTDSGYKLDVNGTGRFSGNLTSTGQNSFFGQSSSTDSNIYIQAGYDGSNKFVTQLRSDYFGAFSIGTTLMPPANSPNTGTYTSRLSFALSGSATFSSSVTASTGIFNSTTQGISVSLGGYIYTVGRIGGSNSGNILSNNGTGTNLIIAETATNVFSIGGGALGGAYNNIGISLNTSTGAATFSSSVTATSLGINVSSIYGKFEIAGSAGTYATAPAITFTDTAGAADSNRWIIGNIATDYGSFNISSAPTPSSTSWTPRITILKAGSVGINTTSPSQLLHTYIATGYIRTLTETGNTSSSAFTAKNSTQATDYGTDSIGGFIQTQGAYPLLIYTNSTERMRITSGGNVLIGTTTDSGYKLDVNGQGRFYGTTSILWLENTTATTGKNWRLSSSSNGNFYITQNGVVDALMFTVGTGAATFSSSVTATQMITKSANGAAALYLKDGSAVDKWEIGHLSNALYFYNYTAGSESMRITAAGEININTTTTGYTLNAIRSTSTSFNTSYRGGGAFAMQIMARFIEASTGRGAAIGYSDSGSISGIFATQSGFGLHVWTGSAFKLKITMNSTTVGLDIPTSSSGLTAGDLWNDGGTVKIFAG